MQLYIPLFLFILFLTTIKSTTTTQTSTRGVLDLDIYTFDKVITGRYPSIIHFSSPNQTRTTIISDQTWNKLLHGTFTIKGIIFAKVTHNPNDQELQTRFEITDDDLPVFLFISTFDETNNQNGGVRPSIYKYNPNEIAGQYTVKALGDFIRKHTVNMWIRQQGCIEYFDTLALQMRKKSIANSILIKRAELAVKEKRVPVHEMEYARYYVNVLKRYSNQPGYIERESRRLKRKKSTAPRENRRMYSRKLNILNCFNGAQVIEPRNERKIRREEEEDKYFLKTGRIMGMVGGVNGDL